MTTKFNTSEEALYDAKNVIKRLTTNGYAVIVKHKDAGYFTWFFCGNPDYLIYDEVGNTDE